MYEQYFAVGFKVRKLTACVHNKLYNYNKKSLLDAELAPADELLELLSD